MDEDGILCVMVWCGRQGDTNDVGGRNFCWWDTNKRGGHDLNVGGKFVGDEHEWRPGFVWG